jgi:hypothetical protein
MNDIDSTLYHFVNGIISDCLLQSPNNWLQIFREESKQKMEDLISEGEDRTQAEAMLGLVMISTQGLLAPGLGIYKWPHELFCLISQFSQDSIGDLERLDNADTSYYELVLSVSQVSIQGVESAIDHLESNPENSSLDFEPSTAIEQLNSSKEIFDKIRLELDEYFGAS